MSDEKLNIIKRCCLFVSSLLEMVKIPADSNYLHRFFILRTPLGGIFLHRFMESDPDEELHNHMWPGFSIILSGSYKEEKMSKAKLPVKTKIVKPGNINIIGKDDFHRVELQTADVWTLFFYFRKVRSDWGFLHPVTLQYTPWRIFCKNRDGFVQENID